MGKAKVLRVTMERNTLRATTPLVSDKVAKTLIAKNTLYEKELSDVYKTVVKEKNYCAASFEKSKKDLIKSTSIELKESTEWASKKICIVEKVSSGTVFETESRSRSSSLPTSLSLRRAKLHLNRSSSLSIENRTRHNGSFRDQDCTSMYDGYIPHSPLSRRHAKQAIHSPDSPTSEVQFNLQSSSFQIGDSKDDVFESPRLRAFDAQSLGSSPTDSQISDVDQDIPEILISEVDKQVSESPQRKTSLTKRSYSTGDLSNVLIDSKKQIPSPCSSPLLRRALSSCVNSESSQENLADSNNNTKYGSLDESLFERFNDMLTEANIPKRPKPRPKLYTEEPFYLRKKCVIRRCLQNKTDLPIKPGNPQSKEKNDGERPLAEILPPIALPPIYTQQNNKGKLSGIVDSEKNKNKGTGIKRTNAKIGINDPRLTENLNDCRYLRSQAKR